MTLIEVAGDRSLTGLLARAVTAGALPGGGGTGELPDRRLVQRGVTTDLGHLAEYAEVCGFRVRDELPVTWPHLAAFPLSIQLMGARDFPFPLIGMVHVANRITQHRPIGLGEAFDVEVGVADLRPHPKGRQFDVVATVTVDGDVAWESTSTYLRRGGGGSDDAADGGSSPVEGVDVADLPLTAVWRVPADIGRQYGAVSGDRNPIHLSALSARAFGFPKAIAHGMWTLARSVAALDGRLPAAVTVDAAFKRPVLLPSKVEYATRETADGWAFGLRSPRSGAPHLAGTAG